MKIIINNQFHIYRPIINMNNPPLINMDTIYLDRDYVPSGYIILCIILTRLLIVFIILWAVAVNINFNSTNNTCFGPFGVQVNTDANVLNICGTNQTSPCIFSVSSVNDCETQCNILSTVCSAFTYNASTSSMKIVQPSNTFASSSTDLYVRQNGMIS